ncbi:fibroblast growth factor receptor 3-like [Acropora muricata]|uniref:fibroblast growth factor receptor 3-like n=1 Tax=Acropora muricata TaxID=159855 RepID=UPI0034E61B57
MVAFTNWLLFIVGAVPFLNSLQQCEMFRITSSPESHTVVVESVNSSRISLVWTYTLAVNESIRTFTFFRRIPGDREDTRVAIKRGNRRFVYSSEEFRAKYEATSSSNSQSATLVLLDVTNSEEYTYTMRLITNFESRRFSTTIVVYIPPKITSNTLNRADIDEGQDLTLSCNATGDPQPNITWTRDGVPNSEFKVLGQDLRLVDVKRRDVGSYRCTASNGYGENASEISIVGLHCKSCRFEKVNITLTSEHWNETLMNRESNEFRSLERNILSAIMKVYIDKQSKLLYSIFVEGFSSHTSGVVATVHLWFGASACEPLQPLRDKLASAQLGQFTVKSQLDTFPPVLLSTATATTSAGPEFKETFLMFHVIYLAVICFLLVVNVVLAFLLWRRCSVRGFAETKTCCKSKGEYEGASKETGHARTFEASKTDVLSNSTNVLSLNSLAISEMSLDTTPQAIYDACEPTKDNWEVSRERINLTKEIGKGAFCQVAKADAWNINGIKGLTTVAVKMLKGNSSDSDRKDLLSELELMKNLKPHPHVVKLLGCVTKSDPLLVLIEYIPYGDLLGFLRKSRGLNDSYYKNPDVKPRTNLTSQQMMQFAWQIADGMHFLSSNKIIHRDLAARNVLVGEGEKCKVTDFGLARDVSQVVVYTKRSRGRLPVKWTAPEALLFGSYTTLSDVWSFGVVLYEIFTVGGCPYPGINGHQMADVLKKGYRMPKPKHVDQHLYDLMYQCWQQKANDRPMFSMLKTKLSKMIQNNEEIYINMREYNNDDYGYIDDLFE